MDGYRSGCSTNRVPEAGVQLSALIQTIHSMKLRRGKQDIMRIEC
jgi:hypothetical protein